MTVEDMVPRTALALVRLCVAGLFLLASHGGARAGFEDGIEAYRRGDFATARTELTSAALNGSAEAQFLMGQMNERGEGSAANAGEAWGWYKRAAAVNHLEAQFRLAESFEQGRGVPLSMRKALDWYTRAADRGHLRAMLKSAELYRSGRGTRPNLAKAVAYLGKAAADGDADAEAQLERMASEGLAVKTDPPGEANPTDAGAIKALADVRSLIGPWIGQDGPAPLSLRLSQDPRVVIRSDGYLVVLPGVVVSTGDGLSITVGTIRLTMTPDGADRYWMSAALPSRMTVVGKDRAPAATVTIGRQEQRMLWSVPHGFAITANATYEDVRVVDRNDETHVDVGPIRYLLRTTEVAENRVDREETARIGIIQLQGRQASDGGVSINGVTVRTLLKGLDRAALEHLLKGTGVDRREAAGSDSAAPLLASLVDDAEGSISIDGFRLAGAKGVVLATGRGEVAASASDGRQAFSRLGVKIGIDDMVDPADRTLPRSVALKATLDRLPAQRLATLVASFLGEMGGQGGDEANTGAADRRLDEALKMVVDSGTLLQLDDMHVLADAFDVRVTGSVKPDPGAAYRAVGDVQVDVRGLDAMLAAMTADHGSAAASLKGAGKGKEKGPARLEKAPVDKPTIDPATVEAVRAIAATRVDASGRNVDGFHVALTNTGDVFVNARPLVEVLAGGGPAAAPGGKTRTPRPAPR